MCVVVIGLCNQPEAFASDLVTCQSIVDCASATLEHVVRFVRWHVSSGALAYIALTIC